MPRKLIFYFDVVCPFSYIAAVKLKQLGDVDIVWEPVLLGGLYRDTKAPQGKDGHASDVMSPQKKILVGRDMLRCADRAGCKIVARTTPRTLLAQRWLTATPAHIRHILAYLVYESLWKHGEDVTQVEVLRQVAQRAPQQYATLFATSLVEAQNESVKEALQQATTKAVQLGIFGVPTFRVVDENGKNVTSSGFWMGQDRMPLVAMALGKGKTHPAVDTRVIKRAFSNAYGKPVLRFFHDFSSPWSRLGASQVERICAQNNATLEYRPMLLGAVFRQIGTANVPMATLTPAKRAYSSQDIQNYSEYWGVPIKFPSVFPIRTVLPLRCSIVEPRLVPYLYDAAWQHDINIGDKDLLAKVIGAAGFAAQPILAKAETEEVKNQLKANTSLAVELGVCGAPSFQVLYRDGTASDIVWGQDRLDVVCDYLNGWRWSYKSNISKL